LRAESEVRRSAPEQEEEERGTAGLAAGVLLTFSPLHPAKRKLRQQERGRQGRAGGLCSRSTPTSPT